MSAQAQAQASEDTPASRKRKRKTYSCLDCRRRKLKCDREHPCSRCIKEGHSESCAFRNDGHNSDVEEPDGSHNSVSLYQSQGLRKNVSLATESRNGTSPFTTDQCVMLQRKVASLESKLAKYESLDLAQGHSDQLSSAQEDRETTFFRGTSFRTSFYGPTNPGSSFVHVCWPRSLLGMAYSRSPLRSSPHREEADSRWLHYLSSEKTWQQCENVERRVRKPSQSKFPPTCRHCFHLRRPRTTRFNYISRPMRPRCVSSTNRHSGLNTGPNHHINGETRSLLLS